MNADGEYVGIVIGLCVCEADVLENGLASSLAKRKSQPPSLTHHRPLDCGIEVIYKYIIFCCCLIPTMEQVLTQICTHETYTLWPKVSVATNLYKTHVCVKALVCLL